MPRFVDRFFMFGDIHFGENRRVFEVVVAIAINVAWTRLVFLAVLRAGRGHGTILPSDQTPYRVALVGRQKAGVGPFRQLSKGWPA